MSLVQSPYSQVQRLAACALIAAGLWMRWPVLYTGFTVDDYAQLAMMDGSYPVPRGPLSLFTFSDGSPRENTRLREVGFFPWWSDPELRVSLMRPLSSALMWFDRRVLGTDPFAYHLHSAAWWIAMLLAIWELLRRVIPGWASVVALGLLIAHPAHTVLLGWIANRNALVATTFAVLGLLAQLHAQQTGRRSWYPIAASAHVISLLASEYAAATLMYGVALSVFGPGAPARRGRALAIWCACGVGYIVLRASLGFGTRSSGMYLDPLREPLVFLAGALQRLPVLMGDAVLAVRSSWWSAGFPWARDLVDHGWLSPRWADDLRPLRRVQVGIGVVACLVYAAVLWRSRRRELRFLLLGVPLAILPGAASLPESRLMLAALIGWSAVLSHEFLERLRAWRAAPSARAAVSCTAFGSLLLVATLLPLSSGRSEIQGLPQLSQAVSKSIAAPWLDTVMGPDRHVLLVGAVDPTTTIYIPLVRSWHRRSVPASCQLLMAGWGPLRMTRVSESAFVLERLNRNWTAPDVYAAAFTRTVPKAGQHFRSGDFEVHVLKVVDDLPMRVHFELHRPLETSTLIMQTEHGLQPLLFPQLGQAALIEPARLPLRLGEQ